MGKKIFPVKLKSTFLIFPLILSILLNLFLLVKNNNNEGMALIYDGNTLINEKMIESGWVRYHHDISSKEDILKKAKEEKLGIYALCQSMENTMNPKCHIKLYFWNSFVIWKSGIISYLNWFGRGGFIK